MFRDIVQKELLDLILSLRFVVTAVLVSGLMTAAGLLFVDDYREGLADYRQNVNDDLEGMRRRTQQQAPLYRLLSFQDQRIYLKPIPTAFLAEGGEKDLPNAFSVDAFVLHSPQNLSRKNPSLWRFQKLDWTFVVTAILSFSAMVLTYDGISRERERQVLRLVMAQPVSRSVVILGKYVGAVVCLMGLLLLGASIHLVVLSVSGLVPLGIDMLGRAGAALLVSGPYISTFVLMGLFISSRCRESATSLVLCLLVWSVMVVAVPNAGGVLASGLVDVPGPEEVADRAQAAGRETYESYNRAHPDPKAWVMSGNWSPGETLGRAILVDEARERVYMDCWTRMLAQARMGRALTRVSPAAACRYAMESIAGSGLEHFARFMEQGRRYREGLKGFLLSKYPAAPDHPYDPEVGRKAARVSVGFEEIPKFEERLRSPGESLRDALPDMLLTALWGVLAFAAAYVSFLRCDVR